MQAQPRLRRYDSRQSLGAATFSHREVMCASVFACRDDRSRPLVLRSLKSPRPFFFPHYERVRFFRSCFHKVLARQKMYRYSMISQFKTYRERNEKTTGAWKTRRPSLLGLRMNELSTPGLSMYSRPVTTVTNSLRSNSRP